MSQDLSIKCKCGQVRGVAKNLSVKTVSRVTCYCKSCQNYARILGATGDTLNQYGGTEVIFTSPSNIEFSHGSKYIECMKLTEKGPLRWYTGCCNSPIGNTLQTSKIPFISLVVSFIDQTNMSVPLTKMVGPVLAKINVPSDARCNVATSSILTQLRMLLRHSLIIINFLIAGYSKNSPFFCSETGSPTREALTKYIQKNQTR
jgi:hypothetical protein